MQGRFPRQLWPVGLFCSPWPEQALRANIHCQISLALNRIYTEWYPSKGYSFNITNSTSYDQYYVHGRTVFDVMVRLTDDIFNTYIRKTGTVNPYYAEYCDGKSVTCPGLKQWGTVTLANQGRSALSILKYYYGSNIEIIRTNNIQSIPQSYPGSPLRQGSTGAAVFTLQRQLNRITKDYPFLGLLTVDGIFGRKMTETVKKFQKQFNLTADGVVGRSTWYKISYIYVSVKDLAELTSEGETFSGTLPDSSWNFGSSVLKQGSTGSEVEQMQFWLSTLAQYESSIPSVTVDGVYGSGTAAAVRAFQRRYGLTVDGIVGLTTWTELYDQFRSIQSDNGTPNAYPGTALRQGSSGQNVRLVQFWLKIARTVYSSLNNVTVDGIFGSSTAAAVRRFQTYFGLTSDGVVGRTTWNKLYEVYNDIANRLLSPSLRPGEYPGVLRNGSTGTAVRELQFYLYLMSAYQSSIPSVTVDGVYGSGTAAAVRAFQRRYGLTVDGIVGLTTWTELYDQFRSIQSDNGTPNAYPGTALRQGSSGQNVRLVQFWLKIARTVYSSLNNVTVDGIFGSSTAAAVRRFQTYFGLTSDGVVGRTTWNKLYEVYNDIANRLLSPSLRPGEYPGVLRNGSTGTAVRELQFYLYLMSAYQSSIPSVSIDGRFGAATEAAVRAYQRFAGLTVDGIVGRKTWDSLYGKASALRSSGPVVTLKRLPYPGTPLTVGTDSSAVLYYTLLLQRIAYYYDSVASPALSSQYTQETADATASAQELLGLPATGVADAETWTAVEALSLQLAAFTPNPDRHPEQGPDYPDRAMKEGSAGPDVSLIEGWLNDRSQLYCEEDYVADNAVFGPEDTAAVKDTQQRAGLEPNGVVDRPTWAALRAQSHTACDSCTEEG